MLFSSWQDRYRKRWERFYIYVRTTQCSVAECREDAVFFTAPPVRDLLDLCEQRPALANRLITDLGAHLAELDPFRACLCGLLIGRYGERGASSSDADRALVDRFLDTLKACLQAVELICERRSISPEILLDRPEAFPANLSALFATDPEPAKAAFGMGALATGLLSRLAASRPLRDRLRQEKQVIPFCEGFGALFDPVFDWLPGLLRMAEEGTVLLLSLEQKVGAEVAFQQVDSNFLLFTLLQNLLYREGLLERFGAPKFVYDPALDKCSRHLPLSGKERLPDPLEDNAGFDYYAPFAPGTDGKYDILHLIWGEGSPSGLPQLDGKTVLLLAPLTLSRRWGEEFLLGSHPRLRPAITLTRLLDDEEAAFWIARIRSLNPPKDRNIDRYFK